MVWPASSARVTAPLFVVPSRGLEKRTTTRAPASTDVAFASGKELVTVSAAGILMRRMESGALVPSAAVTRARTVVTPDVPAGNAIDALNWLPVRVAFTPLTDTVEAAVPAAGAEIVPVMASGAAAVAGYQVLSAGVAMLMEGPATFCTSTLAVACTPAPFWPVTVI